MPLIKGKSQKAFKHNVKTEYEEGKPLKQSLAIAFAMKRKHAKRMADGGEVKKDPPPLDLPGADSAQDSMRKAFKYAEGGQIKNNYQSPNSSWHQTNDRGVNEMGSGFVSHEGDVKRPNGAALSEDDKKLNQHLVDMHAETSMAEEDLVDRIMIQKSKDFSSEARRYSEGGRVANSDEIEAGFMPNEFDDLHLRDDLESSYGDDDNAGDALGNSQEDEDRKDIVSRIMASRRKKDRLPDPA